MKKVKIKATPEAMSDLLKDLETSGSEIELVLEIKDTSGNYEKLCKTSGVSWEFEKVKSTGSVLISPVYYTQIKSAFDGAGIKMKDVRDIIMVTYSYYTLSWNQKTAPTLEEVIEYYLANYEKIKEQVYSEQLIMDTIMALSKVGNPLLDYLDRIDRTPMDGEFEEYYRRLFKREED